MSRSAGPDDDDRTVARVPSHMAAAAPLHTRGATTLAHGNGLPMGTALMEYEIAGLVGEGGFGIVYLANDQSLHRRVAIKEYMPSQLATRDGHSHVSLKSEHHRETFEMGLRSFVNEARLLAQFDHPSLVKVFRFWEANGTAYMAMPYYEGITLKEHLRRLRTPPDEAWLMGLLGPLTEALLVIHGQHCYHRDIAPDNIVLLADSGRPVLLDFGAARRVIGDMTQALTVILKPGYAPLEQYAEMPHMSQGPWTDVYALAAVVHYAITGHTPPAAVSRMVRDDYVPLAQSAEGRYSARLLQAVDRALALRPNERTPSIAAFHAELGLDAASSQPSSSASGQRRTRQARDAAASRPGPLASDRSEAMPAPPPRSHKGKWLTAGALAIAALGVAGFFAWPPASPVVDGPLVVIPQVDPSAESAGTSSRDVGRPSATGSALPSPTSPFSVLAEFDRIMQAQTPGFAVEAAPAKRQLRIGRDRLSFTVSSQQDGHVYVLAHGPDGSLTLLFPNTQAADNTIRAGQRLQLPQASWMLEAFEPAGTEHFLVLVSRERRNFSSVEQGREGWFRTLKTGDGAAELAREFTGQGSVLAGRAACSTPRCDEYAAARFEVEIVR